MRYAWISRLACICSLLIAGKAQASIYEYFYTGNVLEVDQVTLGEPASYPGYQGVMRINERLLPGGTLANATITLSDRPWGLLPQGLLKFTVFPFPATAEARITFTTDAQRRIISWDGDFADGPPDGRINSVRGDWYYPAQVAFYRTTIPGTWSDPIRVYDTPPSIPLPLGGVLLLTALGGLAVHRLRLSA